MWNLKHMRATQEGKMDVCAYCRLHPDGGQMVCSTPELAKIHSFCFPCLKRKNGIKLSDLTGGDVKVGSGLPCRQYMVGGLRLRCPRARPAAVFFRLCHVL